MEPLIQAELSVLVDVLNCPDLLLSPAADDGRICQGGGFISRCVLLRSVFVVMKVVGLFDRLLSEQRMDVKEVLDSEPASCYTMRLRTLMFKNIDIYGH